MMNEKGLVIMHCVICKHGKTEAGQVTVTLERGAALLVFGRVAAQVCTHCGEACLDEATTARLLHSAEQALHDGVQVEILDASKVELR
jgi:YgiT-type zinc finger domain-containing protein